MAMSKIDRIDREIEKTRGKITEYQNRLKELEAFPDLSPHRQQLSHRGYGADGN